jgi:hypothetical protein
MGNPPSIIGLFFHFRINRCHPESRIPIGILHPSTIDCNILAKVGYNFSSFRSVHVNFPQCYSNLRAR